MRTKLVRIGNSRGVRLPKALLEASGITEEVDLTVEEGRIVMMRPERHPREGWAESARVLVENGAAVEDLPDWLNMPLEAEEEWEWPEDHPWPEDPIVSTFISQPSIPSEDPKSPKPVPARSSRRRN